MDATSPGPGTGDSVDDRESIFLSVVSMAYNEAENLPQLVHEISVALRALLRPWEMVIVDDGSNDSSQEVLKDLMAEHPNLRVLSLRRRSGQTAGLDAGLRAARGLYIATLDADLQNDPADIPRMLEMIHSGRCDMVNGWRERRRDSWVRLASTRVANRVRNYLNGDYLHDSACDLRVFRRECVSRLKLFNGLHRFLATLVRLEGYRVIEIPVNHRARMRGKTKYGIRNRATKALIDALAIRWMQDRMLRYQCDEWKR